MAEEMNSQIKDRDIGVEMRGIVYGLCDEHHC